MLGSAVENASSPIVLALLRTLDSNGVSEPVTSLGDSGEALTDTTPTASEIVRRAIDIDRYLRLFIVFSQGAYADTCILIAHVHDRIQLQTYQPGTILVYDNIESRYFQEPFM